MEAEVGNTLMCAVVVVKLLVAGEADELEEGLDIVEAGKVGYLFPDLVSRLARSKVSSDSVSKLFFTSLLCLSPLS